MAFIARLIWAAAILLAGGTAASAETRTVLPKRITAEFQNAFQTLDADLEFAGHGPLVTFKVALRISGDRRSILADAWGQAKESPGNSLGTAANMGAVVYTAEAGAEIRAILAPRTSASFSYLDKDHHADFVCEGAGEVPLVDNAVILRNAAWMNCTAGGPVTAIRFLGDTNGEDLVTGLTAFRRETRTSAEVVFAPLTLDVKPSATPVALQDRPVSLPVPFGASQQENFVGNNCSASVGFRMLRYYGSSITFAQMVDKIRSRFHVSNLLGVGIPPGDLRDAMNAVSPGFAVVRWNLGSDSESYLDNRARRATLKANMISLLRQKKPVIALVGWGKNTALRSLSGIGNKTTYAGLFSPVRDDAVISKLHYVVVRGYRPLEDVFEIVDNGMGTVWRSDYLADMMLFDRNTDFMLAINAVASDVAPGTVIYKYW
jgi:hypothetical protein